MLRLKMRRAKKGVNETGHVYEQLTQALPEKMLELCMKQDTQARLKHGKALDVYTTQL